MILDREALHSEGDQFAERLAVLEAKLAQIGKLEALLEQMEQEKWLIVKKTLSYMMRLLSWRLKRLSCSMLLLWLLKMVLIPWNKQPRS